MMKTRMILHLFGALVLLVRPSIGQNSEALPDTGLNNKPAFNSILNIRPETLGKHAILFSFQAKFPEYYKYFNPKSGNTEQVPKALVINEAYYNGQAIYGLTDRVDLYAMLPVASVHHYSLSGTIAGKGFGDIVLGGNYSLLNSPQNSFTTGLSLGFPTGKYKNTGLNDYPLGLGSFRFKGDITGLHRFNNLDMVYSTYYEYRTDNADGLNVGDEVGAYLTFQKQFNTRYGNFGIEGGAYGLWNFKDKRNDAYIPWSDNYEGNVMIGGWYKYLENFYLRVGVPYTIYQNQSWSTKYTVLIQLDYYFSFKK